MFLRGFLLRSLSSCSDDMVTFRLGEAGVGIKPNLQIMKRDPTTSASKASLCTAVSFKNSTPTANRGVLSSTPAEVIRTPLTIAATRKGPA
ncbi:hypothetical protein WDW86_02630 [Bdellovibrionota bacterium FG-2]